MKDKERLDILLIEKGFFTAREKAKAAIMAGELDDVVNAILAFRREEALAATRND